MQQVLKITERTHPSAQQSAERIPQEQNGADRETEQMISGILDKHSQRAGEPGKGGTNGN